MTHVDVYVVAGVAAVVILGVALAAKVLAQSIKWTIYLLVAAAAAIYAVVRYK